MVECKFIQLAAFGGAACFVLSFFFAIVMMIAEYELHKDDAMHTKYPDRAQRWGVMMDFNHTDNVAMITEAWSYRIEVQSPALFLGILEVLGGISFLLVGLSIKQHIKRQVDEKELLMTMCLSAGVMFGILEVMMKAGPRSYGAWVARSASSEKYCVVTGCKPSKFWRHFTASDWHALNISYGMVESIGVWVFSLNFLFLAVGMFLLSSLGTRVPHVMSKRVVFVGYIISVLLAVDFTASIMRQASWKLFMVVEVLLNISLNVILVPAWLVMMGKSLGSVETLEDKDFALLGDTRGREMAAVPTPPESEARS